MGWSCGREASKVVCTWEEGCRSQTGSSNKFKVGDNTYFFEVNYKEHADGAITGSIYRFITDDTCVKTGNFRIAGNGEIIRSPKTLKQFAESKGLGKKPLIQRNEFIVQVAR